MPHAGRTVCLSSLVLFGCAQEASIPTPRYPTAPRAATASLAFTPASAATRLTLPCTERESEIDNGLDDDCDGRVDRQAEPSRASLFIALSHNTQVDVELALSAGPSPSADASLDKNVISRVQVCQSAEPFAIQQAAFPQLEKGKYEVAVTHGKVCGADLPVTVDASLWLEGKAQGVYAIRVAPGERTVLGTVEVR